ncbi:hypothetical protein [Dendrosporobacter sp. 1207_IL3150]|uniref:hypothetical protein n=1 Tax=Dendrosporobacter sp. 1207_IL3150 TaxID=3084054 RepID=UPI002FD9187F
MEKSQKDIMLVKRIRNFLRSEKLPLKARKDFIALGFLSAYTQLLSNEKSVQAEIVAIRSSQESEYLETMIHRNISKIDNDFVQYMCDYIMLLYRRYLYKYGVVKGSDNPNVIKSKVPRCKRSILLSFEMGITVYKQYENILLKSSDKVSKLLASPKDNQQSQTKGRTK